MAKFTLILSGQTDIVLQHSAGRLFAPAQLGFTDSTGTNLQGISLVGATTIQPLDLVFDAALNEAEFARFQQFAYQQEKGGQKGDIVLRNEWYRVNANWASANNRSTVGSAVTVGGISQSYIQYPVLLLLPEDWFEPLGTNSGGQWWSVKFTAKELTA
jgi:hypothetical protein